MNKIKRKLGGRPWRSDSDVDLRSLGTRLRQLRAQTTQEEFATFLGISQAQLSKYELGQSAPPLGVLVRLAEEFGKSTDWILTGKSCVRWVCRSTHSCRTLYITTESP